MKRVHFKRNKLKTRTKIRWHRPWQHYRCGNNISISLFLAIIHSVCFVSHCSCGLLLLLLFALLTRASHKPLTLFILSFRMQCERRTEYYNNNNNSSQQNEWENKRQNQNDEGSFDATERLVRVSVWLFVFAWHWNSHKPDEQWKWRRTMTTTTKMMMMKQKRESNTVRIISLSIYYIP